MLFLWRRAGQAPHIDSLGAVVKQHPRQQIGGCAGGHDIVDQRNVPASGRAHHSESVAKVAQALVPAHALLGSGCLLAHQAIGLQWNFQLPG